MLPPEWIRDLDVGNRRRGFGVDRRHPVGEVAVRAAGIDPVHVVGVGIPRVPARHRLESAHVHHRNRDHRSPERRGIHFADELGHRERSLLFVAVDAAVEQQHRPRARSIRDQHRKSERRSVHPVESRDEPRSARSRRAFHGPDDEFVHPDSP